MTTAADPARPDDRSTPATASPGVRIGDGNLMFTTFSLLLAVGILFHELITEYYRGLFSHHTLMWLSALWCLMRPSSLVRFQGMMVAMLVGLGLDLPWILNHSVITLLLALAALLHGAILFASRTERPIDTGEFYRRLAPAVRTLTVLVYLFAALAKMNAGFFDPSLSAGISVYGDVARVLPLPTGEWTHWPVILGTVLLETALPVLLLFPRTRVAGLLLAVPFHLLMGVGGHTPFSGLAFALLFPFVPEDFPRRLRTLAGRFPNVTARLSRVATWAGSTPAFVAAAAICLVLPAAREFGLLSPNEARKIFAGSALFFWPYAAFVTGILLYCLRLDAASLPPTTEAAANSPHSSPATGVITAIAAVLVIINGLSPYLGLKTQTSFTMYSNLQTEGDQWNHLFMPRAMRVFSFQDDLVRILDSDDPALKKAAEANVRWVHFEFQRHLSEHPEIAVVFEHRGQVREVAAVKDHPDLVQRPPLLLRRLLFFRPVPTPQGNTIQH